MLTLYTGQDWCSCRYHTREGLSSGSFVQHAGWKDTLVLGLSLTQLALLSEVDVRLQDAADPTLALTHNNVSEC